MLIVKDLGVQFTTSGVLGFETSQFIEQHKIVNVLINEVITMVCIEIAAVLTDCSCHYFRFRTVFQSHSMPVPLFCTPELWIMFSVNGFYFTKSRGIMKHGLYLLTCSVLVIPLRVVSIKKFAMVPFRVLWESFQKESLFKTFLIAIKTITGTFL